MVLTNASLFWVLALLALSALAPLAFNRQRLSRRARAAATALRLAALALVGLALMEPATTAPPGSGDGAESAAATCLVDVSTSVKPSEVERSLAAVKRMLAAGKPWPDVLLFGRESYRATASDLESLATLPPGDWLKTLGWTDQGAHAEGTNLEKALRTAADLPARTVVLASDGRETEGQAEKALAVLLARGQRLACIPLESVEPDTLSMTGIALPREALEGRELEGQVTIRSAAAGRGRLVVKRSGQTVKDETVELAAGTTTLPFTDKVPTAGIARYEASIEPLGKLPDGRRGDDRVHGAVRIARVPKVLIVSNRPEPLKRMLTAAAIEHRVRPPQSLPTTPEAYTEYSAVLLDNVDAADVVPGKQKLIANFVREQGGGLLALGGDHGFGAGGWTDTEIEKVLPVHSTPKGYDRGMGLIVLLDSSGSMAGFPIEYARKATKEIIALMRGRWLGVINFSHQPETAVGFQVIGADSYVVRQDIEGIQPGGGTLFYQPLAQALEILRKVSLDQKHILLVSDGVAADFFMCRSLYDSFDRAGIHVSTMAVGRHVDVTNLEEIASATGGKFYQGQDFSKMPEMFKQEVKRISGPPVVETAFRPIRSRIAHPLAAALPAGELPLLYGFDATAAKPRAEVLLTAPSGDPILAVWHAGVGKAAAFTSDLSSWGRDWAAWPSAPRFLAALIGELGKLESSDYRVSAAAGGSQARVVVDAVDAKGAYLNFQKLIARVSGPDGRTSVVAMRQSGSGRYETAFPLTAEGAYGVQVCRQDAGRESPVGETAVALHCPPELRPGGADRGFLERLASATGGRLLEAEAAADADAAGPPPAAALPAIRTPLWPLMALLGLGLFLAEIVCRRLGKFAGSARDDGAAASGAGESAAFQKIAENYLKIARDMDGKGNAAKAADAYLKARSYFLKAQKTEQAKVMWDRYRLLEDRRMKGG